jgi:hypothetical protein
MNVGAALIVLLSASAAAAQELDPRAYTPAPVGTTVVLGGVGGSKGAILFDPSLDVADVQADLTIATVGVGYTFGLFGRQARALVVVPFASGTITGQIHQFTQSQDLSGIADPRIKISVGLHGAPALGLREFVRAPRRTAWGASVTLMPPTGQYEPTRLVNIGYHRWAIKPEMGLSRPIGPWTVDAIAGVWLFTINDEYFPGRARKAQNPLYSIQTHVSHPLPHRTWVAVDATWFAGGETRVDGVAIPDRQRNTRLGATLSIPVTSAQSVKLTYSTGTSTRRGTDFDTLNVMWQLVRF